MEDFRPWGQCDWLLRQLPERQWSFVGCCGTEERSVALARHLGRRSLQAVRIVEIIDPEPLDRQAFGVRLGERRLQLRDAGFSEAEILRRDLLSDIDTIANVVTEIADEGGTSLVIDLTSLPKYWFFPLIQSALSENRFRDIIVTYTSGLGYADVLSENITPIRSLPGFNADPSQTVRRHESLVIGIGFEPIGLDSLLSEQSTDKIKLIFPFPPGPPGHRRNWMFVKHVEELTQTNRIDPPDRVHIHMYDSPQVFDALCTMTENGRKTSALAPYGPKPVSLAMCLFAIAASKAGRPRVPVFYAQPLRYAIDYTTTVSMRGGRPDTISYSLRLAGRDLYTMN